ncbi:thiaminase II [Halobacillus sp. ACCC02827]|uniref:thiaminase II n=1 Tax=Bacillaceae TaxID=186817 RepID=UPI0002A4EE6C|nr:MULTISPECIES: thiaminase II [Bacillaceae]ELK46331.1 thiaminase [Halobacillus sp. BAB-2008]QHT48366.1 thiaminase II [Bacillus sp. SB49]WJE15600.1 thiaminase II [Halobacillus sp. ACCC02827]
MSFSTQLRKENQDVFEAIFHHPFVEGLGKGELPKEAVAHYVKADFEYLNAFMHVYGIAVSKSPKREDIELFNDQINFVLHSEVHPHNNLCRYIGKEYEELQGYPLPPTADHYIKHMLYHAHMGSIGEIIAALLPCPWTYLEIGKELTKAYQPDENHPFFDWIDFYAEEEIGGLTGQLCEKLDAYAEQASDEEKNKMREAFRKSCQLELSFWEMAYTVEEWPVAEGVYR